MVWFNKRCFLSFLPTCLLFYLLFYFTGDSFSQTYSKKLKLTVSKNYSEKLDYDMMPVLIASSNEITKDVLSPDQNEDELSGDNIFLDESVDDDIDSVFNINIEEGEKLAKVVEEERSSFSFSGSLKNETAYRLDDPHDYSKIKNILTLNTSGRLSDTISFVFEGRFSYDAVFDLNDRYNSDVESDQKTMADLRDAYLDMNLGEIDLRLGNQQIVWGQAVGLFFADIVNPKDLREFILPDLDQARIPVLAANAEFYISDTYIQFIFIPFPEFNEFGEPGAEFDFSKPLYIQDADIIFHDPEEPANSLDNSEIGARINKLIQGWDLSVFYLYDYYNFPVNYRTAIVNPSGSVHPVTFIYCSEYERIHRLGATFSKDYADIVFKGEFIYSSDMFYTSSSLNDADGIVESPSFELLLGFDYTFFNTIDSNFQLLQEIVLDHESDLIRDKYSTSFSVWLKTGFLDNRIEPELFFITSFNDTDGMVRPKISYNYNDSLKLIFGVDIFYGDSNENFGMFDENDRVYLEILYNF